MPTSKAILVTSDEVLSTLLYVLIIHRFIELDVNLVFKSLIHYLFNAILRLILLSIVTISLF